MDDRLMAAQVAAGLIKNRKGEIVLYRKNGFLTIPTEHMNPKLDKTINDTLIRGVDEELPDLKDIEIVEVLQVVVRRINDLEPKSIAILSCNTSSSEGVEFLIEKGKKHRLIWIRPSQAQGLKDLDLLAQEALGIYLKKYPPRKTEGNNNDRTRGNSNCINK